ncbi:MAG: hypothetical protein ABL878_17160 [Burkholderiales bacterium]
MSKKQILISAMMMALSAACITTYAKEEAKTPAAKAAYGSHVADASSVDKHAKKKRISRKMRDHKTAEPAKN